MRFSIFDKILYGSDWMMVIKEKNFDQLVDAFDQVFVGELAQYRSGFFGENAVAVLQKAGNSEQLPEPIRD
jgi:predicted TIM-barrel fold metal-dependent hydrolase